MLRIIILFLFINSLSFAQKQGLKTRVVDFDDIYIDKELLYEYGSDNLYSGFIHRTKKKQLIQEQYVVNSIIHYEMLYYRGEKKIPCSKYIYNKDKPFVLSQILKYHIEGDVYEVVHYDTNGKKVLEENFEDNKLIYSCEFNGRKRHGKEFCITEECDTTFVFYANGKKQRNRPQ